MLDSFISTDEGALVSNGFVYAMWEKQNDEEME